jgi:ring-1,2-phenylacetyl-CoA epoxidase subunit PaaB
MKDSLDPRVNRLDFTEQVGPTEEREHFQTFEVFHQERRGGQPVHVGIVHAPNPEMAMLFAKEQYGRRLRTANIWVALSSDIHTLKTRDEDIFSTTPQKKYREAAGYSVRDKIDTFKKEQSNNE